jgi:RND family efflux transporter MFP subunit
MRKLIALAGILVFLGVVGYRVYKAIESKKMEEKEREVVEVRVKTAEVKLGTVEDKISLTGNIEPQHEVTVYSKVSGEVEKIAVDVGEKVKKGELIAEIEKEKLILQVERLDASLEAAEINVKNLSKDYERIKSLFEKDAVSQQKMDNIDTAYRSTQARVKELRASLDLAKIHLADSRIYAPINGTIARKFIDEGEMIIDASMTKNAPLVTIVYMDTIKVMVNVTERDIADIEIGQEARVKVDAYPDKVFTGKVSNISPVLDLLSRTAPIEIGIINPDYLLKPGMFARVEIITEECKNVLIVPIKAILYREGKETLFVVEGNIAKLREVETGVENGGMVEITSGLKEKEKVIIEGAYGLKNGDRVQIE